MRKIAITAMMLSVSLTACQPSPHRHVNHHRNDRIYHFRDGRTGYQDDFGIWWFLVMNNQASTSTTTIVSGSRLGFTSTSGIVSAEGSSSTTYATSSFARGPAPSAEEVAQATPEEVPAIEVTEAQEMSAEPIEADATGGTPISETAPGETSAASGEGSTSSSDAGTSSSSDGGGGGGDGGGGGSD